VTRPEQRSRITNGAWPAEVDGRGSWPRRFRDLVELHTTDLGGPDLLSEAERQIVRRIAGHEVELERMEAGLASAGEADPELLDLYIRMSGSLKRLLDAIGLGRRARPVPSLDETLDRLREANA